MERFPHIGVEMHRNYNVDIAAGRECFERQANILQWLPKVLASMGGHQNEAPGCWPAYRKFLKQFRNLLRLGLLCDEVQCVNYRIARDKNVLFINSLP